MTATASVCPGERLRFAEEFLPGPGTYVRDKHVLAAVVGDARVVPAADDAEDRRPTIEVVRRGTAVAGDGGDTGGGDGERVGGLLLPQIGDEVFAKVTRTNPKLANVEIVCVNGLACADPFNGIVRVSEIRASETAELDLHDCFVPGDIIRGRIISLGDARSYYVSTAENELGVVRARSPFTGEPMIPAQVLSIKFFTHCPVSTFDRALFQLTGETFLYGMALSLLNIVDAFGLNVVWPMLPFMVESYGVASSEKDLGAWVGFAGAATSVGQLLSSYPWGVAADRFGRRPVMLLGMFLRCVLYTGSHTTPFAW